MAGQEEREGVAQEGGQAGAVSFAAANLKPSYVLERAAALIEPEGAWTQGAYGRDVLGAPCGGRSDKAVCRCAAGAILNVGPHCYDAEDFHRRVTGQGYEAFNDAPGRTQAEVVAALRQAAELARSEGH